MRGAAKNIGEPAPGAERGAGQRLVPALVLAGLALSIGLITRWQYTHENALDDDELQHIHFAWCITQGMAPYRDFWDNHTPALHYALARIITASATPSDVFITARRWMFVVGITTLAATFLLAREAFDARTAVWAVAWLACCEAFIDKTVEIRPDGMLSTTIVLGLWLLARALRAETLRGRSLCYFGAGLSYGLGFTFSPKVLIALAATAIAWAAVGGFCRARRSAGRMAGGWGVFAAGLALPPLVWLGYEAWRGALEPALRYTLLENFSHFDRFSSWLALRTAWPFAFFAAALLGGGIVVVSSFRATADRRAALLITITAMVTASVYAFLMPSPYLQSTAMFVPSFAVLAGHVTSGLAATAASTSPAGPRRRLAWIALAACILAAVVHPIMRIQRRRPTQREALAGTLRSIDWVHSWTSENDVVFDGRCLAAFRRHALFRPSLVRGVLSAYWAGTLTPPIRDELRSSGCTVMLRDGRSGELPPDDRAFVDVHFVQLSEINESLFLPGQFYEAADLEGDGVEFEVITPGFYWIQRGSPASITLLKGAKVSESVRLEVGVYRLRSSGPPSSLKIARRPGK